MSQETELNARSRRFVESLVSQYLEGRHLSPQARAGVVSLTEKRFNAGQAPALNAALRAFIDRHAIAAEHAFLHQARAPAANPVGALRRIVALLR